MTHQPPKLVSGSKVILVDGLFTYEGTVTKVVKKAYEIDEGHLYDSRTGLRFGVRTKADMLPRILCTFDGEAFV